MSLLSSLLSNCLRNTISDDTDHLLGNACERPWGLIAITDRATQKQGLEDSVLKRCPVAHVSAKHDDYTIVLLPYAEIDHFIEESIGKEAESYRIAISLPFNDASVIPQQYGLITYCLETGERTYEVTSQERALDYLKHKILESVSVNGPLHPALDKLRSYDRSNQSDMLETLKVYLDNDRNAQRCANMLYLHRNSLQYRVRRIQEIAGIDLDDPNERAYLRLSLLLSS